MVPWTVPLDRSSHCSHSYCIWRLHVHNILARHRESPLQRSPLGRHQHPTQLWADIFHWHASIPHLIIGEIVWDVSSLLGLDEQAFFLPMQLFQSLLVVELAFVHPRESQVLRHLPKKKKGWLNKKQNNSDSDSDDSHVKTNSIKSIQASYIVELTLVLISSKRGEKRQLGGVDWFSTKPHQKTMGKKTKGIKIHHRTRQNTIG